jgi:hypothetical protein
MAPDPLVSTPLAAPSPVFQFYLEIELRGYVSQRGYPQPIQIEKKIETKGALVDKYP